MRHGAAPSQWPCWALRSWCLALAATILGPALAPGYTLSYDMVFVPHLSLGRDALGLGDALPRAVPVDAVVALLSSVVPGQVLQKLVLLATLVVAGLGAARLTPSPSAGVRAVAATAYVWNPYVAERLVLGHWALLVAYAVLPWLVLATIGVRAGERGAGARALLLGAAAALTATGGVLAVVVAVPILLWPGVRRRGLIVVGGLCAVALNAPWWLPGLLHGAGDGSGARAGVEAFAARGENALGPIGSLLALGGVWNAQVVPDSRGTVLGLLATMIFVGLAVFGLRGLRAGLGPPVLGGLLVAGGVGLLLATAPLLPGGTDVLAGLVRRVPGAGLLRDGQKWLAPYAVLLAPAVAMGVGRLAACVREADLRRLVPVAAIVVLLACLPDLTWGAAGRLRAVDYPDEWSQVRSTLTAARADGARGDVLVLPWSAFRAFSWNGNRTVLDPAPRWFPGAVASDDLVVRRHGSDLVVPGDADRATAARTALDSPDPRAALSGLGIGWVLVERDQPVDGVPVPTGKVVHTGPAFRLIRLGGAAPAARPWPGYAPWVIGTDALVALGVLLAGVFAVRGRRETASRRVGAGRPVSS
jgi:hypothetical protein